MIELKLCPLCGGNAILVEEDDEDEDGYLAMTIACLSCEMQLSPIGDYGADEAWRETTAARLTARWNHRIASEEAETIRCLKIDLANMEVALKRAHATLGRVVDWSVKASAWFPQQEQQLLLACWDDEEATP